MRISILLFVLLSIFSVNIRAADYQYAQCVFPSGSNAQGTIQLISQNGVMNVVATLSNVMNYNGELALSIMKYGFNPNSKTDLGGVFDASNSNTVGCPSTTSSAFRIGDLGNINVIDGDVSTTIKGLTKPSLLATSDSNVIGRSIVIQNGKYDCNSPASSSLGSVIASCVIGLGNPSTAPTDQGIPVATGNANTAAPYAQIDSTQYDAVALISTTSAYTDMGNINGQVSFVVDNKTIDIKGSVTGLNKDVHGFHVHVYGDLTINDGSTIGGHWLQNTQVHGLPETANRHNGDLGNLCIFSNDFGTAYYKYSTEYFPFSGLAGRGFAIHMTRDTGGSDVGGARIAQGVVALIPKGSSIVTVPSTYQYDVVCANGAYAGSTTSTTSSTTDTSSTTATTTGGTSPTTSTTDAGEPGTSSFLTPFISLIVLTIISTLFIL